MAEENDDVANEMMGMITEEAGDDAAGGEDLEEQMLKTTQDEIVTDGGAESSSGEDDLEKQMIQAMATESGASPEATTAAIKHLGGIPDGISVSPGNIGRVLNVRLSVSIELGNTEENISTLLQWTEGSLIELDKVSGDPVDVIVNNKPYARGEVVVIAECFGVRLTKISPAPARSQV
ncbi:MAG: FliM/FliN family flagellar motor switch protein [Candidatus Latescibacterota bacterium]|nr:FliM/FliN family flagellar motor switch protein [Candidatus Latescibacterota bacterium]